MKTPMMPMKMKSMKRSAADKRKDQGDNAPIEAIAPDYPYGLVINLDADEIEKLGMRKMPEIGAEIHICAVAKVTRVVQSAVEGVDEQNSISLQITDLAFE